MTQAVLHGNPGSAAHSPLPYAASSTTSPPASAPWPPSPAHGTSAGPIVDTRDASRFMPHRTLRCLHQQPAQKRIPLLADVSQPLPTTAAGMLRGNQTKITGQLVFQLRAPAHQLVAMQQQLPRVTLGRRRHPDPRKTLLLEKLH